MKFSEVGSFEITRGLSGLALADVDGDGLIDIIVGERTYLAINNGIVSWYKNIGNSGNGMIWWIISIIVILAIIDLLFGSLS